MEPKLTYTSTFKHNAIYFMQYRAKGAEDKSLSVYDRAPLIIPLDIQPKTLLAVNLHWIPKNKRAVFLDNLLDISKKYTKRGFIYKINLLYQNLKGDAILWNATMFAIRKYLYGHIKGIQEIPPELYDKVLDIKRLRSRFAYQTRNYKH